MAMSLTAPALVLSSLAVFGVVHESRLVIFEERVKG
jgi:hypothetical protein